MDNQSILRDTKTLETVVDKTKIGKKYPILGSGAEGKVYKLNEQTAFKIFFITEKRKMLKNKLKKLELLAKLRDESFAFPTGILENKYGVKEGYLMPFIHDNEIFDNFDDLLISKNYERIVSVIIKASDALERIHKLGVGVGDIRGENILLDENFNPIFIDTDNFAYADYGYDLVSYQTDFLHKLYKKNFSLADIDKYILTILTLQSFVAGTNIEEHQTDAYFAKMIELMPIEQELKDGLREILSDHPNKPYLGPILKRINPKTKLISWKDGCKLNDIN